MLSSAYRTEIEFKSTTDHPNSDSLSHLPLKLEQNENTSSEPSIFNIAQINSLPMTNQEIRTATHNDPVLSKVYD